MPVTPRTILRLAFGLHVSMSTACAGGLPGWHRAPVPIADTLPQRQQVQIWRGNRSVVWHGIQLEDDTLTGIRYHRPLTCDSCREAIALESVDSLRVGSLERVGWLVAASPWLIGTLLLIYIRTTWGSY